jgi:hypothetical protein
MGRPTPMKLQVQNTQGPARIHYSDRHHLNSLSTTPRRPSGHHPQHLAPVKLPIRSNLIGIKNSIRSLHRFRANSITTAPRSRVCSIRNHPTSFTPSGALGLADLSMSYSSARWAPVSSLAVDAVHSTPERTSEAGLVVRPYRTTTWSTSALTSTCCR